MTVIYTKPNNNFSGNAAANQFGLNLNEEKKIVAEITQEVKQELIAKWKKAYANVEVLPAQILAIHPEVVNFLLGFNLVSVYDNISRQVNLDAKSRNILPQIVWQIAKTKNWNSLDQILEAQIPLVHSMHVTVAGLLEQNIINKIRTLSEKPFAKKENVSVGGKQKIQLSLAKAIAQYPKLGEQSVTENPLKLKYFETLVRPSIKNWITDFHDNMGAGKHGAIDRGNYLFHGENGKKLTSLERQKLSNILKSLDENSLITIDPEKQIVVFDNNGNEQLVSHQKADVSGIRSKYPVGNSQQPVINQPRFNERSFPRVENGNQIASRQPTQIQQDSLSNQSGRSEMFASRYGQPVNNMQRPAYNSNEQFEQKIPTKNVQKDIFQQYAPIAIEQEQKPKKSFFQKLFSKNDVQPAGPVLEAEAERKELFPFLNPEKVSEKMDNPLNDGQKNYFQRPIQKPTLKPTLESDNYFSNFGSGVENKPSHNTASIPAPIPNHAPASPISTFPHVSAPNPDVATKVETRSITSNNGNISFSSSQKFSNEKKIMRDSQWHIKPLEDFGDVDDIGDKTDQASKNIVNLKN